MTPPGIPWSPTISEPRTVRTCSLAGINKARNRLVELRTLKAGLEESLRELERSEDDAELWNSLLLVARVSRATCNAFLAMAAAASGQGDWVETAYGLTTAVVDGDSAGVAKAGSGLLGKNVAFGVKSAVVKGEFVHAGLSKDADAVKASVIELMADLSTYTLEYASEMKRADFRRLAKAAFEHHEQVGSSLDKSRKALQGANRLSRAAAGVKIAHDAQAFDRELSHTFDRHLVDTESTKNRYRSLKAMTRKQVDGLQRQIVALDQWVAGCAAPEAPPPAGSGRLQPR